MTGERPRRDARDVETRRRIELGYLRDDYVRRIVDRRVDRNPNVAAATIAGWEADCYRTWAETYPALASMFPPPAFAEEGS